MKVPKNIVGQSAGDPGNDSADPIHSTWADIICDKCGKSCIDDSGMNYEYATIKVCWGYGSKKDTERHEAHICEKCYDGLGLKPQVDYYL